MAHSTRTSDGIQTPIYVSAADVRTALPIAEAVAALERGFLARDQSELDGIARSVVPITRPSLAGGDGGGAELLLMPAHGPEGAGLKLVSIVRDNPSRDLPLIQGLYLLLSRDTLTPELLIDGAALTGIRTAAVSALATRYLARASSRRLVVFGAGAQGRAHVAAMRAILPIDHVTIVGATAQSARAGALVDELRTAGVDAAVGDARSIRCADVVCTCTTSTAAVFTGDDVRPGTHINAVGAYRLDMLELPASTLQNAVLVVESIEATLEEAGDVVVAIEAGMLPMQDFAHELGDVLRGQVRRSNVDDVTIFKSVGLAVEDLILARAIGDALSPASGAARLDRPLADQPTVSGADSA